MGGFNVIKPDQRHRVIVVAETRGPRDAGQQRDFREALKRLFAKHASVMLPPKTSIQRRAFKAALRKLLGTNLTPEKAKKARSKAKQARSKAKQARSKAKR